jgi:excisionase family DNA binding protein
VTDPLDIDLLAAQLADRLADRLANDAARRYLPVSEAATYCGISEDSVRSMLTSGRLTALRPVPGRIVIDRRQLDAVVQASTGRSRRRRGQYHRATGAGRSTRVM